MTQVTTCEVYQLARQLPPDEQVALAVDLLLAQWSVWRELSEKGQQAARRLASERGLNWDMLSEPEREQLIDEILHDES